MKRKALATSLALGLFLMGLAESIASAADLVSQITGEQLVDVLKEEGYSPKLDKPSVVTMKIEGLKVAFFVADDNSSLQAYAAFKSEKATLERVNEWNADKRYSRAYLDSEGDPVIELDLDLAGGVSKERLADFIQTVRISIPAFAKQMFAED